MLKKSNKLSIKMKIITCKTKTLDKTLELIGFSYIKVTKIDHKHSKWLVFCMISFKPMVNRVRGILAIQMN
jgi:hypothetical protein